MVRASLLASLLFFAALGCSGGPGGASGGGSGASGGGSSSSAGGGSAASGGGSSSTGGGSASSGGGAAGSDGGLTDAERALIAARPYRSVIPSSYDGGSAVPLVVLLHGYGLSGSGQDAYFGLSATAQAKGFLLATPDGKLDRGLKHFWNATDACCDYDGQGPDDVAYVTAVIDDMASKYRVDSKRVFLMGHSNGGFMSHRYACEHAEKIAGIASLAGANWKDMAKCQPSQPLAVLEIHGTADTLILYDGGTITNPYTFQTTGPYPPVRDSIGVFAQRFGCEPGLSDGGSDLDLDYAVVGAETRRQVHANCADGGVVALWTLVGGGHIPGLDSTYGPTVWEFLSAHPKP